jgi:hypothetical protein
MRCSSVIASCFLTLTTATAADFASLAADLESEQFNERQAAEQALLQSGLQILNDAFAAAPLPEDATDDQIDRHFERLQAAIRADLEQGPYRHLAERDSFEARFRAERIKQAIDQRLADEMARAQVGLNKRLPDDLHEKVYGYTGGFREGTTWFDAQYGNNSQFTITSIRILVRLTHQKTGEKTEIEVVLTSPAGPLLPGQQAVWSADTGMLRTSDHDFFWKTRAVFGSAPAPPPGSAVEPR